MAKIKHVNIKTQTNYFYIDQINLEDFGANLLKVGKKDLLHRLSDCLKNC